MSYTPEDQNLEAPARKILEGIKEYSDALDKRLENKEAWQEAYLLKWVAVRADLLQVATRLNLEVIP